MHSKRKGNIGQFAIALKLAELGFSIFTEEGDISKIDIIAEKKSKILRIQCKATMPQEDGSYLKLYLKKNGPNYSFQYEEEMFDFFGLYDLVNKNVYFIPSSILNHNKSMFYLRLKSTINNQKSNNHFAEDYLPEIILKEYIK